MPIPRYLNCSEIPKALEKIEKEGFPWRGSSTTYCLVHEGKHYAPKVVVSYTVLFQCGEELRPPFLGGRRTRMLLERCEYQVIRCPYKPKCRGDGTRPNQ